MKYLDMTTVQAKFEGTSQLYSYFVPAGDKPERGDYLVTSCTWDAVHDDGEDTSPRDHAKKALSSARIARVVAVELTPNPKATRFYLKLLSMAEIVAQGEANSKLSQTIRDRAEAKAKLDKMLLEQDRIEQYRRLAANNGEAADLLKVLEA